MERISLATRWESEFFCSIDEAKAQLTRSDDSDYIENNRLDRYDAGDLDDDEDFSDDPDARRAAEARMQARDRRAARAPGAEGRKQARMPAFMASDEEDSEDEGRLLGQRRVRRNYDEPMGDDEAGYEEVRFPTARAGVARGWPADLCSFAGVGDAY